jgi:tetratricopeptide (TPR) repeat protein
MTRLSRPVGFIAVGCVVLVLGAQQLASTALLAPYAVAASFPRLVPEAFGERLATMLAHLPVPSPVSEPLRAATARRLLAEGHVAAANAVIARLPEGAVRADLLGVEAAASGAAAAAADDFIAAGDVQRLAPVVDAVAATDPRRAIALQNRLIARLRDERLPSPDLADAYWKRGVFEATLGYVGTTPERARANAASRTDYERALRFAPNSVKYLLSLANQQANMGARAAAIATFRQILVLDPHVVDARNGLRRLGATSTT